MSGCGSEASAAEGGRLIIKVNPQVAVDYDESGAVTDVEGLNDDGKSLLKDYSDFEGKNSRTVVKDIVALMSDGGYFKTEKTDAGKQITISIEPGSKMPGKNFLKNIVADVKTYMGDKPYTGDIVVEGESNYGISDYAVSPYGDSSYGDAKAATSAPTSAPASSGGNYGNTDYGSNTNYGDSAYSSGGGSKAATSAPAPAPTYSGGDSGYDGNSGYDDSGNSGYDDSGNSGYDDGDSGYDD